LNTRQSTGGYQGVLQLHFSYDEDMILLNPDMQMIEKKRVMAKKLA
jgi:hypothetical protein